jgi:predicted nuclease of predicted toxin-antitoxin system
MKLYLDENLSAPGLAGLLTRNGHHVVRSAELSLLGVSDARNLEFAIRSGLTVLTADRDDFRELHDLIQASGGNHPGILLVRYDNDSKRDMRPKHIVKAIAKLERASYPVTNDVVILNQWR